MPHEQDDPGEWLRKANTDLRVVRRLLTPDCAEWDAVGFHCQQAIEKSLKAFLVARGVTFLKIHNLDYLVSLCATVEARVEPFRPDVAPITAFGVQIRYPGPLSAEPAAVTQAAAVAERIWLAVHLWLGLTPP